MSETKKEFVKKSKDSFELPKGAKVVSKEVRVVIEEIENGFLVCKNHEIRYLRKDSEGKEYTDYAHITKKYFSKVDPLTINVEDKTLADLIDE